MGKDAADTLGLDGRYVDPVWRVTVELTPLERELLECWWVRRLGFIAHAGAAVITTTQSYSRLEHSLGVLALTSRFTPDDVAARASALLHDIGHLPFSHTFEGLAGLDHHALGRDRVVELDPVLRRHGLSADDVLGRDRAAPGAERSGLGLDHLDSFLRSGQAHGRTARPPAETLGRLRLIDGVVDTDEETAGHLAGLVAAEAAAQCSAANVAPYAVLRGIARTLLEGAPPARTAELAAMTDDRFWALALEDPRTAETADRLRRHPGSWTVERLEADAPVTGTEYTIRRLYTALPTVDGRATAPLGGLPAPPLRYRVRRG